MAVTPQQTAWAVGYAGQYPSHVVTLIEHWDGTAWIRVPSPSPAGKAELYAVAAASDSDVGAVGSTISSNDQNLSSLIECRNGTAWTR